MYTFIFMTRNKILNTLHRNNENKQAFKYAFYTSKTLRDT